MEARLFSLAVLLTLSLLSWIVLLAGTIGAHVDVFNILNNSETQLSEAAKYQKEKYSMVFAFNYWILTAFAAFLIVLSAAAVLRRARGVSACRRLGEPVLILLVAWSSMTIHTDASIDRARYEDTILKEEVNSWFTGLLLCIIMQLLLLALLRYWDEWVPRTSKDTVPMLAVEASNFSRPTLELPDTILRERGVPSLASGANGATWEGTQTRSCPPGIDHSYPPPQDGAPHEPPMVTSRRPGGPGGRSGRRSEKRSERPASRSAPRSRAHQRHALPANPDHTYRVSGSCRAPSPVGASGPLASTPSGQAHVELQMAAAEEGSLTRATPPVPAAIAAPEHPRQANISDETMTAFRLPRRGGTEAQGAGKA